MKRKIFGIIAILIMAPLLMAAAGVGISAWTAYTEAIADGDFFAMTDISDTTDSDDGSSKKATGLQVKTYVLGALPTADNQIIQATGVGTYGWTSSVAGLIDDTATNGDTDKIWSADKNYDQLALKADVNASTTGNAATATALAANGGNCSAGSYPLGVDASGAVEGCTDVTTEIASTVDAVVYTKCLTISEADEDADFMVESFPHAITVTEIRLNQLGATNVVGQFDECNSAGASCTAIDSSDLTATTGQVEDTSPSNASVDANDVIAWHTTSVSGTNTQMLACFDYTVD